MASKSGMRQRDVKMMHAEDAKYYKCQKDPPMRKEEEKAPAETEQHF